MKHLLTSAALVAGFATSSLASVYSFVDWTSWDVGAGTAQGTIPSVYGNVGVTLTGPFTAIYNSGADFTPVSTYADGTIVSNAPNTDELVRVETASHFKLDFDRPVSNLAFVVWSVGAPSVAVTYTFDHDLQYVCGGPNSQYGGSSITTTGNSLTGVEGNGTVLFPGPLNSLSFDVDTPENWHGFHVGLQAVPEPASMAVLGLGLLGLMARRRR